MEINYSRIEKFNRLENTGDKISVRIEQEGKKMDNCRIKVRKLVNHPEVQH